jgi:8-oxo-dGTP pyrophosphatase MutT (NUDIX family)
MDQWRTMAKRGVWLKIPIAQAVLIPVATGLGFVFHHAEPDYVMMTHWLPADCESTIPPNASHQVGVGAFVINDEGQLLVVQEAVGNTGFWKIPTGLVDAGEHLEDACVRECQEETGIEARFESIVAFRHALNCT